MKTFTAKHTLSTFIRVLVLSIVVNESSLAQPTPGTDLPTGSRLNLGREAIGLDKQHPTIRTMNASIRRRAYLEVVPQGPRVGYSFFCSTSATKKASGLAPIPGIIQSGLSWQKYVPYCKSKLYSQNIGRPTVDLYYLSYSYSTRITQ